MKKDMEHIVADNLERLRKATPHLESVELLAEAAGVSPNTVRRTQSRETTLGIDNLEKLARAFGRPAWHLLLEDLNPALDYRVEPAPGKHKVSEPAAGYHAPVPKADLSATLRAAGVAHRFLQDQGMDLDAASFEQLVHLLAEFEQEGEHAAERAASALRLVVNRR